MEYVERFLEHSAEFTKEEFIELLKLAGNEAAVKRLADEAVRIRKEVYGTAVFIRGLIEFTNY